jgi:hypothetical protein
MPSIHDRVVAQIEIVLEAMESHPERYTTKDRLALIEKAGMFLTRDLKLKAANESEHAGSSVRKYKTAFLTQNVPSGGKKVTGRSKRAAKPAKPAANGSAAPPDTTANPVRTGSEG